MNTQTSSTSNLDDLKLFRRFLPAPLSDAAQKFWLGEDGAKDCVIEFMEHRQHFEVISNLQKQSLLFQLIRMQGTLSESLVDNLLNTIHLASGGESVPGLDEWISVVTGVILVSELEEVCI